MMNLEDAFTMEGCRLDRLDLEEKKIKAAHNGYMYHLQKSLFDDGGWHNLRAFLINRVEQLTNYRLIVVSDDDDSNPNYRIIDRKTYLKEAHDFDWNPKTND